VRSASPRHVRWLLGLAAMWTLPSWAGPTEMHKQSTRFWAAKLSVSADGDLRRAAQIYEDLSQLEGTETATLRREALLQLANVRLNQGDLLGARAAFERCHRINTSGEANINTEQCLLGARKVAVRENAVTSLPVKWTFDDENHGFVVFGQGGTTTVDQGSLVWRQELDQYVGRLVVGLRVPNSEPVGIRLSVRAEAVAANLSMIVKDQVGNVYWEPKPFLAGARTRTVEVRFKDLTPWDESMPPIDPNVLVEIQLLDTTELLQSTQQTPIIIIEEFEIF